MAHERSPQSSKLSSSSILPPSEGELPVSPLAKLRGKSFGQSVVDFDLDEDFSSKQMCIFMFILYNPYELLDGHEKMSPISEH